MAAELNPVRVLAVYAHPDDPEIACGGSLIRWARGGAEVHVLILTAGEKGTADPAESVEELIAVRAEESRAAAEIMGLAGRTTLGLPDGEIENTVELRAALVRAVRELRPDVVMTHDPTAAFFGSGYVNHHDHRECGWAVLDACAPAAWSPLYFPDAGEPHRVADVLLSGTLEPDHWVDVEGVLDAKVEAVRCHRSQLGDAVDVVPDIVSRRASDEGRQGGLGPAESFRRIHLAG